MAKVYIQLPIINNNAKNNVQLDFTLLAMVINCQLDGVVGCPDIWSHIIWVFAVGIFR